MMRMSVVGASVAVAMAGCAVVEDSVASDDPPPNTTITGHRAPLAFEENRGQVAAHYRFVARRSGLTAFVEPTGVDLVGPETRGARISRAAARFDLIDANGDADVEPIDPLIGTANYFHGRDRSTWLTAIPTYAGVRVRSIYPGIDIVYGSNDGNLTFELDVAPGADLTRFQFQLGSGARIADDGGVVLARERSELQQSRPIAYQTHGGRRASHPARYIDLGGGRFGVDVSGYDATQPLVIDPTITLGTYLGGTGNETARAVAITPLGELAIVGVTSSPPPFGAGFGGNDVYVAKIEPATGAMLWTAILGDTANDTGEGVAVDEAGFVYVTGTTSSPGFPHAGGPGIGEQAAGGDDCFVTKLSPDGTDLVYSRFLGGDDDEECTAIALDQGQATVTGTTFSTTFPTYHSIAPFAGNRDAFVTKLSVTGTALKFSTFLGSFGDDVGTGIAYGSDGRVTVVGWTSSPTFPTVGPFAAPFAGIHDCFVTRIDPFSYTIDWSTLLGGGSLDYALGVAVDRISGDAFVTGLTLSDGLATSGALQQTLGADGPACDDEGLPAFDGFAVRIAAAGPGPTGPVYFTYLGGSCYDAGRAIAVDDSGRAYVTGWTDSIDYVVSADAIRTFGGDWSGFGADAMLTILSPNGATAEFSTYLGGRGDELAYGIATSGGVTHIVGDVTGGAGFPLMNPVQPVFGGGSFDMFVMSISR